MQKDHQAAMEGRSSLTLLRKVKHRYKILFSILVVTCILAAIMIMKFLKPNVDHSEIPKQKTIKKIHRVKTCLEVLQNTAKVACMKYQGRLGNLLYMYAFHYVYSIQKDVSMVRTGNFDLDRVFVLEEGRFLDESQYNSSFCGCMTYTHDRFDCGYDENIVKIQKGRSVSFLGYFQSWKYWIDYEDMIRILFKFRPEIKDTAIIQFRQILKYTGWHIEWDLFIGIHVRRGDYAKQHLINFGQKTAPLSYINNAMSLMSNIHNSSNVKYIVFSDDIKWCKLNIRRRQRDIYYVENNPAAIDMALMTLTNHSIITAGTFSWWAAFLTNGTTIYYRDIFTKNTRYAQQFPNQKTDDFFPTHWIGLDK